MSKLEFLVKTKQALTTIFHEVSSNKEIFEFGIYLDQDITSMLICYHTTTYFANQLKDIFLKKKEIVSDNRWLIPEWDGQISRHYLLDEANDLLYYKISREEAKNYPDSYKDNLLELLFNILFEMKKEGIFDKMEKDFILYIQQADSYIDDFMETKLKELLGEKHFEELVHDLKDQYIRL